MNVQCCAHIGAGQAVLHDCALKDTHCCRWQGQEHREHPHVGDIALLQEEELISHAADLHYDSLQQQSHRGVELHMHVVQLCDGCSEHFGRRYHAPGKP